MIRAGVFVAAVAVLLLHVRGGQVSDAPNEPAAQADSKPTSKAQAALEKVLDARGWAKLPRPLIGARYSGPTPRQQPGPFWFITADIDGNTWPRLDDEQEAAFTRSIEKAHAGGPRLVEGGLVLLVDPDERIWCVAAHMPHVLRCFDGRKWSYKRADGTPAADDEPAAFSRLARENKLPRHRYAKDGLRDLNDPGRWLTTACADSAGNLHFFAACNSEDAAKRDTGGGGVYTLRRDGTWTFFRIYPAELPRSSMQLGGLRCIIHPPAPAREGGGGDDQPPTDLVTVAEFTLSDSVAEAHGHGVEPIPDDGNALRKQQWKPRTEEPRHGPKYLLRFDGRSWRFDRSCVGWGVYDAVFRTWPQPDGTAFVANRFGLWMQWPKVSKARLDRLIADLFEADPQKPVAASRTLASMGKQAVSALDDALEEARSPRFRAVLTDVRAAAEKVARGEEQAVPVIRGRWQFIFAYPQATMPDGRFAFYSHRAIDVEQNLHLNDCLVLFDPADATFEVRPIPREQWNQAGFADKRALEPPIKSLDSTVIDREGGIWVPGGFRCGADGRLERLAPAGLQLRLPHLVDPEGRIYFYGGGNQFAVHLFRPGAPAEAAGKPGPEPENQAAGDEHFDNVRALFRQEDLRPPWNAWAVQEREGDTDLLLRLDGLVPTPVEPPAALERISAVVPLDGGCIAAGAGAAAYWNGDAWDVAPDVRSLVERHGGELVKKLPTRVFAADTSDFRHRHLFEFQLLLASDGRGGIWLAEDTKEGRQLWHWDGQKFTDLWALLPLKPQRSEDGALMTADRGRALVVQIQQNMNVRPGGYWAVWRVLPEDLQDQKVVPQTAHQPGLHPTLLAARGPNTVFVEGMWVDRSGWLWSPIFCGTGTHWFRIRDNRVGPTAIGRDVWQNSFVQGSAGHIWCMVAHHDGTAAVWADVGTPATAEPHTFARMTWVGTRIPDTGSSARLAMAPGGEVYLLHENGCSLLRLRKLAADEKPKLPERRAIIRPNPPQGENAEVEWEIDEVVRQEWESPRNDFDRVAFDESGVWILPQQGPLIRTPLPREPK